MYSFATFNCGFYHQFNNDDEINQLVELMKKNPYAKFHFELAHLGRPSEYFDFIIGENDDGEYGYNNYMSFDVNGKEIVTWGVHKEIPWGAIWSTLYDILVTLNRYGYKLEETP